MLRLQSDQNCACSTTKDDYNSLKGGPALTGAEAGTDIQTALKRKEGLFIARLKDWRSVRVPVLTSVTCKSVFFLLPVYILQGWPDS